MSMLSRRSLFFTVAAAAVSRGLPAAAQATGPYVLAPLPYGFDANEPHIDAMTMQIHHDRHHAAYVANLNNALKDYPQLAALAPDALIGKLAEVPEVIRTVIRNSGGGNANHAMFWQIMGGKGGAPAGALAAAVDRDLGGLEAFKGNFNRMGAGVFGSGWVFVTVTKEGKLADLPLLQTTRNSVTVSTSEKACSAASPRGSPYSLICACTALGSFA